MNEYTEGTVALVAAVPSYLTRFIGRERELELLAGQLIDPAVRWITLTGPGGVGKTRLAVEAAHQAVQNQTGATVSFWFVPLFGISDPRLALEAIARRLDPLTTDEDPLTAIQRVIAGRPVILLLDNADKLVPHGGVIASLLSLPECAQLKIVATSRSPFNRAGESLLPVTPLPLPTEDDATLSPAVQLFIDRARMARLDLKFADTELLAIVEICRRLDGLPLAIELTASKLRQLSLITVAARVQESRFSLDDAIAPHDLPGHTALSDSIASSFELLSDEEREFLIRLSVFGGGISIDSARRMAAGFDPDRGYPFADGYGVIHAWSEHLSEDPVKWESPRLRARVGRLAPLDINVEETLEALAERSLLQRTFGPNGATRYQFLETISEFAQARLAEQDYAEAVHHLHAATMVYLVDIASEGMWTKHRFVLGPEHLDAELANIRLALTWLLDQGYDAAELAMRLADVSNFYFRMRGMLPESISWVKRAVELTDESSYRYDVTMASLGFSLWMIGELDEAEEVLLKARDLMSGSTILSHIAATHFYLALVYWRRGPEYVMQIIQNLEIARENFALWDDHIGLGVTGLAMAEVARAAGDPQAALQLLLQARVDMDEWKYDWGAATTEWFIGEVYRHLHDDVNAAHHLAAGLKAYQETGDRLGMSGCIGGIAALLAARQEWALAARFFGSASVLRERTQSILPPTHQIDHDQIAEVVLKVVGNEEYLRGRADEPEFVISEAFRIARALETGAPIVADPLAQVKGYSRARQQVLVQLAEGKDVKEIAAAVKRGKSTVYRHLEALMEDLNCKTPEELQAKARLIARRKPDA